MSAETVLAAYKTKLGNPVAKSILVRLADQLFVDGFRQISIRSIREDAEISIRTIQCHLKVFEKIGLLEREQWRGPVTGNRQNAFQFSLLKLGTDLRKEFAAALSKVAAKMSSATSMGVSSDASENVSIEH